MELLTQYNYEKKWLNTTHKDALDMISAEMPETDAKGTLEYILLQIQKGKIVTLGSCKFKSNLINN